MPKTLLLADDSVTIQKVVGISFANEDIVLLTVDNGDDAIARAKDARPDVVLADVVMPGKNGYEVCQAIKADPSLAGTPVLLLTGTFEAFDEQRAARAGADGHITKPFEAQSLVDKVNALLARPSAPASPAETPASPGRVELGVMRPVRAEVPAPAPVSHTADTAYDFFDEEITAPRPSAGQPREDATVLLGGEPGGEAAFDFASGEDALAEAPSTAYAPLSDPATTTVVHTASADAAAEPDPWGTPAASAAAEPGFGADDLGFEPSRTGASSDAGSLFDDGFPVTPEPAAADDRGATRLLGDRAGGVDDAYGADEAYATAFGAGRPGDALAAEDAYAAGETRLAGFAPAREDGGDPAATRLGGAFAAPAPSYDFDPGATRLGDPPRTAAAPAPLDALDELELDAGLDPADPFGGAVFDPTGARDYDVSSSDLGQPLAPPPPPEPPPAAWESAWPAEPAPEPAAPAASAPSPFAAVPAPAPAFVAPRPEALDAAAGSSALGRDELRDMLEKMAWEAFGPLTERLVRDAVDRIERVAWEVIPQLAETLIREEIRKLKGE
jgi:CheY-like chemotaxis protein